MSITLNANPKHMRTRVVLCLAEVAGVELKVQEPQQAEQKMSSSLPLKNPSMQGLEIILSKGAHLTAFNAILRFIAMQSKDAKIYGETDFQKALVDQWLEYSQNYLMPIIMEFLALVRSIAQPRRPPR